MLYVGELYLCMYRRIIDQQRYMLNTCICIRLYIHKYFMGHSFASVVKCFEVRFEILAELTATIMRLWLNYSFVQKYLIQFSPSTN